MSEPANVAPFPGPAFPAPTDIQRERRFTWEDFDTVEPSSLFWIVKGLWTASGVAFVAGPSMSGKTFWVLDAIARICRGEPVMGRKSKASGAIYIAAEDAAGVRNRIVGLRSRIGSLDGALQVIPQAPNLTDPEDVEALEEALEDARLELERKGHRLGVLVIDTMSASIPGADENNSKDMSPVLTALQGVSRKLGCLVLVVAHTGKDETRGLRGWSGLLGNADGLVMLDAPEGEGRGGTVVKVKSGISNFRFGFELEQVVIGVDEDGDEMTTCVIQTRDPIAKSKAGRRPNQTTIYAEKTEEAFNRIFQEKAKPIFAPGADGAFGVHIEDLKREALAIGVGPLRPDTSDMTEANKTRAEQNWKAGQRMAFKRAVDHLQASGYRLENEWFWQAGSGSRGGSNV